MKEIYDVLFDRIIQGEYAPDARLKEDALAEEFSVSRTPVREVLRLLEKDGLVDILPKRGARIFTFTADDLEDIYEIRKPLEVLALRISGPSLSIHRLMELRKKVVSCGASADCTLHKDIDTELHGYLVETSKRRRLISTLNQLFRLIQHFRELGFRIPAIREVTIEEHLELIDALCVRDMAAAEEILGRHIENTKIRILSVIIKRS